MLITESDMHWINILAGTSRGILDQLKMTLAKETEQRTYHNENTNITGTLLHAYLIKQGDWM